MRQVGNRGVWIDPTDVVAVARHRSEVAVLLAAGTRVVVQTVDPMELATDADVDAIVETLRAPIDGIDACAALPHPLPDPAEGWDQLEHADR